MYSIISLLAYCSSILLIVSIFCRQCDGVRSSGRRMTSSACMMYVAFASVTQKNVGALGAGGRSRKGEKPLCL